MAFSAASGARGGGAAFRAPLPTILMGLLGGSGDGNLWPFIGRPIRKSKSRRCSADAIFFVVLSFPTKVPFVLCVPV